MEYQTFLRSETQRSVPQRNVWVISGIMLAVVVALLALVLLNPTLVSEPSPEPPSTANPNAGL